MTDRRREQKALHDFKQVMEDLVTMIRKSTASMTAHFSWVNRARNQFVLEAHATILSNVMFQDRTEFDQHFLNPYRDVKSVVQLKVSEEIEKGELKHYYDFVPVRYLTLIPFINNNETVAVTVLEAEKKLDLEEVEKVISAYRSALINVLNTYLELTELYEDQQQWTEYDSSLEKLLPKLHKADIIDLMLEEMQQLLPRGGISFAARGMNSWVTVLQSSKAPDHPSPGLAIEQKTVAYDALQKGEAVFAIHFNQNPKRISGSESETEGATLAVPFMISGRRHGVIVAYDPNPLVFKESVKHQIKNLVRVASLAIQVNEGKVSADRDIFTSEYGNFIPDLWEKSLSRQIRRADSSVLKTWFGFITIENLTELRARLRVEDLKRVQRKMVLLLNPGRLGFNGYIGFYSDYTYMFMLVGEQEEVFEEWRQKTEKQFETPVELSDGKRIELHIEIGTVPVRSSNIDVHSVTMEAKRILSDNVKKRTSKSVNF